MLTEIHDDIVLGRNVYQEDFSGRVAFLGRYGGVFKSYTCDRQDFIGINAGLQEPQGVINARLSEKTGHTPDPCAAMEIGVILKPGEEKTIFFLLGDAEDKGSALALAKSFQNRAKLRII